jgi:hypothetical protein
MGAAKTVPPVVSAKEGTAARFIEIARSQVGVIEGPKDNETDYGKFTGHDGQAWCGSFMMWTAHNAKVTIPNCVYTPAGADAFKKAGKWTDAAKATPQPGDIIFFHFAAEAKPTDLIQHVGVVVKDNGDGTITTVEGNTTPDTKSAGSPDNGGEVAMNVRGYKVGNKRGKWAVVVGFGRPDYVVA